LNLNIENENIDTLKGVFDTVVLCVAHREFKEMNIREFLRDDTGIVYDVYLQPIITQYFASNKSEIWP